MKTVELILNNLRVQEEVLHPSKYAVTRLGYLRGADLSNTKTTERDAGGAGSKKSTSRRQSSLSAAGRSPGGRRRSTVSSGRAGGRRKSSAGPGGAKRASVGAAEQKGQSQKDRRGRGPGVADALQVKFQALALAFMARGYATLK